MSVAKPNMEINGGKSLKEYVSIITGIKPPQRDKREARLPDISSNGRVISKHRRILRPRYNPARRIDEIVPEEVRALPTFPYNEDQTQRWCYRCKAFQNASDFRKNYGSCKLSLKKSRDAARDANYFQNYGISLKEYERMFQEQGGRCAACKRKETKIDPRTKLTRNLSVDHDHATGRVRGLLCAECNSALGLLRENPHRIRGLLCYTTKTCLQKCEASASATLTLWNEI